MAIRGQDAPGWLRASAALVGLLVLARSLAGFVGAASVLDPAAPLAFVVFVLAAGIYLLLVSR